MTMPKPPLAQDRAKTHYKDNIRNNNQTKYVEEMYNLTCKRKQELIVVLSPATDNYKKALPSSNILFKELFDLKEKYPLKIINLYDSDIFKDSYFVDWDHLNYNGVMKLTNYINSLN